MNWKITHQSWSNHIVKDFFTKARYVTALAWHRWYWVRHRFQILSHRYGRAAPILAIGIWVFNSIWLLPHIQGVIWSHFITKGDIDDFQAFMLAIGGALIGATAIAFSFIMFAMQVNVERMPHGLFRKFSTDKRLMGTFIAGFLLAIGIACASLVSQSLLIAKTLWAAAWAVFLILIGLLYAYRRALSLINPAYQPLVLVYVM